MDLVNIYGFVLPVELIVLLVYLPILTSIVTTSRYVIGLKSFGTYAPVVLSFAYYFLDPSQDRTVGLKYGIVITIVLVISTMLIHKLIEKWRMNFFAKMSIVYTGIAISLIASFALMSKIFPSRLPRLLPIPILMISTLTDRLVRFQIKKNLQTTFILTLETIILGILGYFLLRWDILRNFLVTHPEILVGVLIYNIGLGKYANFRLTEFSRFSAILFESPEELQEE